MILEGKYSKANIHTDFIDENAKNQIQEYIDSENSEGTNIHIMPDVHIGQDCVIGYTSQITNKIIPALIGVDIGCGVISWKLGNKNILNDHPLEELDNFIKINIPHGYKIHKCSDYYDDNINDILSNKIKQICIKTHQDILYVAQSLGTLGGGNHFIEIDIDENENIWLVIHSGSRNFGFRICHYHQNKIVSKKKFTIDEETTNSILTKLKQDNPDLSNGKYRELLKQEII